MENEDDQVLYYNKPDSDSQFFKEDQFNSKTSVQKMMKNSINTALNEITHDGSQLMKSPSISSFRMDYKEKTAEFEGEDLCNPNLAYRK